MLLNDTINNIHQKYVFESISFSLLAKMKTFWVLRASERDREIIVQTTRKCNEDEQTI